MRALAGRGRFSYVAFGPGGDGVEDWLGVHCPGFVADTAPQAADDYWPGYAEMFGSIGKERGFAPPNRAHFDAMRGPTGALFVGDPETVAEKVLSVSEALGGISRLTFQMTNVTLAHDKMLHSIELLGTRVAPLVRNAHAESVGTIGQAA